MGFKNSVPWGLARKAYGFHCDRYNGVGITSGPGKARAWVSTILPKTPGTGLRQGRMSGRSPVYHSPGLRPGYDRLRLPFSLGDEGTWPSTRYGRPTDCLAISCKQETWSSEETWPSAMYGRASPCHSFLIRGIYLAFGQV